MKPSMLAAMAVIAVGAAGAAYYFYNHQKHDVLEVNVGSHGITVQQK